MNKIVSIIILIFFLCIGYAFFIEPNKINITRYIIEDDELKGLKIVFPCDFHIRPYQYNKLKKIIELVNKENPDIILSVGDFVSGHTEKSTLPIKITINELGNTKSKYGFFTVLGNHDGWYGKEKIIKELEKNNIKVLENSNIRLAVKGKDIYIAGVEDIFTGNPNLFEALQDTKTPVILLTHSPDIFPKLSKKVNLTLAGHTHGGQVKLPILGPIYTSSKYRKKYASGFIEENGQKMIVSKGLGESILPIRFNCPPEIVVIEFK